MNNDSGLYIFGLFEFEDHVVCAPELLGHKERVVIGGIEGFIEFPSLPQPIKIDPGFLISPEVAKTWMHGDDPVYWGRVANVLEGVSRVERILFQFQVTENTLQSSARRIEENFIQWRNLFNEYLEIVCDKRFEDSVEVIREYSRLELLSYDEENLKKIPGRGIEIRCNVVVDHPSLKKDQFETICQYCNSLKVPSLEHRLQNEAHRAFRKKDYRKAIIETAGAAEIALTAAVKSLLIQSGVDVNKRLNEYKMLGRRYELAKILGLNLPAIDYKVLLIDPRNEVVHEANFANAQVAKTAINAVGDLLNLLVPNISA